jgi:4-amino-4-deoxy-L-arabinose transferase-like glycosyltransferase
MLAPVERDPTAGPPSHHLWRVVIPIVLLLILAGLLIDQAGRHSPTMDEPTHIVAGLRMLRTGVAIDAEHPPLPFYATALALVTRHIDLRVDDRSWIGDGGHYTQDVLLGAGLPLRSLLFRARCVSVAITLGVALVVFFWSRRLWGNGGACFSLFLFTFCPVVLSDGALVVDDMTSALVLLTALTIFRRYLMSQTLARTVLLAAVFGVALLVKFIGVLLVPIFALLYLFKRILERTGTGARTSPPPARAARDAIIVGVVGMLMVWACYGFQSSSLTSDPQLWARRHAVVMRRQLDVLPTWIKNTPIPAYDFWKGLVVQSYHVSNQGAVSDDAHLYLMGRHAANGWWYYFPVALAVKTPLPAFVLGLLALWLRRHGNKAAPPVVATEIPTLLTRRWPLPQSGPTPFDPLLLFIPAAVWLGVCMSSTADMGVRYVMPLFPLAFIALGSLVSSLRTTETPAGRPRARKLAIAVTLACASWYAVGTIRLYPHFHAFFSPIAGGSDGGWRVLNNSSIDWGHDIEELGAYLRQENIQNPYGDLFSVFAPSALGVDVQSLPADDASLARLHGTLAVSVTRLTTSGRHADLYGRLRLMQPRAKIGYSIFIYDF